MIEPHRCSVADVTVIKEPFSTEFFVVPESVCFGFYGWMFVAVSTMSLIIVCLATLGFMLSEPARWHRRAVFSFFFLSYLLRGSYSLAIAVRVGYLEGKDMSAAQGVSDMFLTSGIAVNALADVWATFVDVLLTTFWTRAYRQINERVALAVSLVVTHAILGCCFLIDRLRLTRLLSVAAEDPAAGLEVWSATLWFVGLLMTITAVAHTVSLILLVRVTIKLELLKHDSVRREIVKGVLIASVTALCCISRGVLLLLRQFRASDAFVSGSMSFDNGNFSAAYYLGLMNVPTFVTCMVFADVYIERIRDRVFESEATHLIPNRIGEVDYDFD